MVKAHVAVSIKDSGTFGFALHPLLGQQPAPALRPAPLRTERTDLLAQGAHLGDAIQPDQFAPFPRGHVTQGFQRRDPSQRHQRQKQKDALQRIEAFGHRKNLPAFVQQPQEQQRWQRKQYSAIGNICDPFELDRSSVEQAHGRGDSFQAARGCPA
jgi:hypothetical protein